MATPVTTIKPPIPGQTVTVTSSQEHLQTKIEVKGVSTPWTPNCVIVRHNNVVDRLNWSSCCKCVVGLKITQTSSKLCDIAKLVFLSLANLGFGFYDVARGAFSLINNGVTKVLCCYRKAAPAPAPLPAAVKAPASHGHVTPVVVAAPQNPVPVHGPELIEALHPIEQRVAANSAANATMQQEMAAMAAATRTSIDQIRQAMAEMARTADIQPQLAGMARTADIQPQLAEVAQCVAHTNTLSQQVGALTTQLGHLTDAFASHTTETATVINQVKNTVMNKVNPLTARVAQLETNAQDLFSSSWGSSSRALRSRRDSRSISPSPKRKPSAPLDASSSSSTSSSSSSGTSSGSPSPTETATTLTELTKTPEGAAMLAAMITAMQKPTTPAI
jgi:hypothetical protein